MGRKPARKLAMPFTVALERTGGVDFAVNGLLHLIEEVRFARDSPLEEAGFEPSVPRDRRF
jgi:hypothetical protein